VHTVAQGTFFEDIISAASLLRDNTAENIAVETVVKQVIGDKKDKSSLQFSGIN
jgi:hypothetical protein